MNRSINSNYTSLINFNNVDQKKDFFFKIDNRFLKNVNLIIKKILNS